MGGRGKLGWCRLVGGANTLLGPEGSGRLSSARTDVWVGVVGRVLRGWGQVLGCHTRSHCWWGCVVADPVWWLVVG